ncbi:MAG: putative toxin-antitoxin system toxin component, PIN family [Spirochaetaceae bacterium]|nr:putative toxin-antitoxin system toxin component, PIN family [Spirochaetaceae bacterium]
MIERSEPPVWLLDTNVLVSGLLSPFGPPGRLVDALLARQLMIAIGDRIEAEYRDVLARPRLGIPAVRRAAVQAIFQFQFHVTASPWSGSAPPDEDDIMFLEVALQTSARTLVTGDLSHFPAGCRGPVVVLSPRDAWERFVGIGLRAPGGDVP